MDNKKFEKLRQICSDVLGTREDSQAHEFALMVLENFLRAEPATDELFGLHTFCKTHTDVALVCPKCFASAGGKSKSRRKLAAARRNAVKGGRPSKRKLAARKLAAEKLAEPVN